MLPILRVRAAVRFQSRASLSLSVRRRAHHGSSTERSSTSPAEIQLPPYQGHCVRVSAINSASTHMLSSLLVQPAPAEREYMHLSDYSFLIESSHRGKKLLFDLGMMKDLMLRMPPALKAMLGVGGDREIMRNDFVRDVPDTLQAHGVNLAHIEGIVWSHSHIDHVGDPSVFPSSTSLIVGPGFKDSCMPGYPTNPDALVLDSAFEGRDVEEISFPSMAGKIGGFAALDWFNDGSFFLLGTPGHTHHHLSALCRTTEDSWIFLGADCCHTISQLRPSRFRPLPRDVSPEVLGKAKTAAPCVCTHLRKMLLGQKTGAFYDLNAMMQEDIGGAEATLEKLQAFDGRDDVMVILAHDPTLLDVMNMFPQDLNSWKQNDWANQARWRFLKDFNDMAPLT